MSFDIPSHIEPMIQQYASEQHITKGEAIVRLIQEGFTASHHEPAEDTYTHLFTPERMRHIAKAQAEIAAGQGLTPEQLLVELEKDKAEWRATNKH